MAFKKKHRKGGQTYYELVEGYRDAENKVRHRHIQWLGKDPNPPPGPIELPAKDFAMLAIKLMDQTLTAGDVFDLLAEIGKRPADLDELEAIGIRFDLGEKKLVLYLLPKGYALEVRPRRAPRAKPRSGGKGRTTGAASSPSKGKRK